MAISTKHKCIQCGDEQSLSSLASGASPPKFLPLNNFLFSDGYLPVCNSCIETKIRSVYDKSGENYWNFLDQFCQLLNIGFNPSLWESLHKIHKFKTFSIYAAMMKSTEYETVDWRELNRKYLELDRKKILDDEIPELYRVKMDKLKKKWGENYSDFDLEYLENLLTGILKNQDVNGALSYDQALKLCKVSVIIDSRIRAGDDFDKLLNSYEKLTKIADFTPKNTKNAGDFNSTGELVAWLEKRGWVNKFYDGASQDIVDKTMKNFQGYVRNLYINESSIADEIERKIKALDHVAKMEDNNYEEIDMDYDKDLVSAYEVKDKEETEEFEVNPYD